MKISEIIKEITIHDNGSYYSSYKAKELYYEGVDHYLLTLAKWVGFIKGKFQIKLSYGICCGYCFEYDINCEDCPLNDTFNWKENYYSCSYAEDPIGTIKNIVKQHKIEINKT